MDKDSRTDFEQDNQEGGGDEMSGSAPRARNRTVLLTPDITTQVRARIAHETDSRGAGEQSSVTSTDSGYNSGGFVSVARRASGEGGRTQKTGQPATPQSKPQGNTQAAVPEMHEDCVIWAKVSPLVGFLVSFDVDRNGQVFVLRSGRMVITSQEPPGGSFLFLKDGTVSPMHAIVRISESGEIQVLDQLSEYGTIVKHFGSEEEVKLSGDKCSLDHGDVIKFGNRSFHVCILAKSQG